MYLLYAPNVVGCHELRTTHIWQNQLTRGEINQGRSSVDDAGRVIGEANRRASVATTVSNGRVNTPVLAGSRVFRDGTARD